MSVPDFVPQLEVPKAGFVDRFWFTLDRWIASRTRASIDEYQVNTLYGDSYGLTDRLGDPDKTEQVQARNRWTKLESLRKMYKGEAAKGNQVAGAITDFHAALQGGLGLRHKDKGSDDPENPSPEMAFWSDFLRINGLDGQGVIDLAVCGELDGQVLMRFEEDLTLDGGRGNVRAWVVPLLETRYTVVHDKYGQPVQAVLYPEGFGNNNEERVFDPSFSFVRFRGIKNGRYGIARAIRVLTEMENLDDAVTDWRKINRIFSSPTPLFKAKDVEGIKRIKAAILGMNWKIGKAFVMLSDDSFELVGLPPGSLDGLEKEITRLAQIISGATNVPVHYLGYPELMSNRSVADADFEPSLKTTEKAHGQLGEFFQDVKEKVFAIGSYIHGTEYDPDMVETRFPAVRKGNIEEALTVWLPAAVAKAADGRPLVSRRTFHTKVGIEDPQEEERQIDLEMEGVDIEEEDDEQEDRVLRIADQAAREEGAA